MSEESLRQLIKDKDSFIKYVKETIANKNVDYCFGIKEITGYDKLEREVFWEINENYNTRQYRIYPFKESYLSVVYFTKDDTITFIDENDEDCSEEYFFKMVNK